MFGVEVGVNNSTISNNDDVIVMENDDKSDVGVVDVITLVGKDDGG